jgi:hypothetical protein
MSHTKDIDPRNQPAAAPDDAGLVADLGLIDLLYGELDGNERDRVERRVREDDALAGELEALSRIRSIMRELPDEEPPEAISTKLLHAAAAEVAGNRAPVAGDEERLSVWDRLRRLFMPLMMHPGLAAAASVIVIGGVAGMLYVSNNLKVASPVAREAGQAPPPDLAAATTPAATAEADFGSPLAGASAAPTGVAAAADPGAADSAEGRGGERGQALDEARDMNREMRPNGATYRPPTNAELADDFGAEEQSQGYFAQAPAEEPAPGSLARQEKLGQQKLGKAGRASSSSAGGGAGAGDADTAGLSGLDKNASPPTRRSDEAKQKKEAESYRLAQPTAPRSKARSRDDDGAGYDELASQLETGARSRNAPGASSGAAGGSPAQAAPTPQAAPVQPAPTRTAPARKPSPEPAAAPPPPPAEDRAAEARGEAPDDADDAEADAQAGAPADGKKAVARKAASDEASKERARRDTAARVLALHKQALAAAARGDCATVRSATSTIRSLDHT